MSRRTKLTPRPRLRLDHSERGHQLGHEVHRALQQAPVPRTLAVMAVYRSILATADEASRRTSGKIPTWSKRYSTGRPVTEASRLKKVAAVIGEIGTPLPRNTREWVLDAIEEGLRQLPWSAA